MRPNFHACGAPRHTLGAGDIGEVSSDTGDVIVFKLSWGPPGLKQNFHHCDAHLTVVTWSGRPRRALPRLPRHVQCPHRKTRRRARGRRERKAPAVARSAFRLRPWLSDIFAPLPLSFFPLYPIALLAPFPPPLSPVPTRRATHARATSTRDTTACLFTSSHHRPCPAWYERPLANDPIPLTSAEELPGSTAT